MLAACERIGLDAGQAKQRLNDLSDALTKHLSALVPSDGWLGWWRQAKQHVDRDAGVAARRVYIEARAFGQARYALYADSPILKPGSPLAGSFVCELF